MKPNTCVPRFACMSVMLLLVLVCGCGGGDGPVAPKLVVGTISGPGSFSESTFPVFTVEARGDSSITTAWTATPETAVWFTSISPTSVSFHPSQVETNLSAEIKVVVEPQYGYSITRTFKITIMNDTGVVDNHLNVSEIIGPVTVPGGNWVTYGVETSGDTGVTCQWSVEPPDAGNLTHHGSRFTNFAANQVTSPAGAVLSVAVSADNTAEVTRTSSITINPGQDQPGGLSVSKISGPVVMDEEDTVSYSVMASGAATPDVLLYNTGHGILRKTIYEPDEGRSRHGDRGWGAPSATAREIRIRRGL